LATTAALDIFAYCQYISSMMLFKAMSQGESPLLAEGGGGEDKSPASSPTSPDIPQDYSMKSSGHKKAVDHQSTALPFETLPPSNGTRSEPKKPSGEASKSSKSENGLCSNSNRKLVSSERRPRQAYNTKQLERLESEFQVCLWAPLGATT